MDKTTKPFFSKESKVLTKKGFEALKMRDPVSALEIFRDAVELDEKNLRARVGMGQAYYELGRLSEAEKIFQMVIKKRKRTQGEVLARSYEGLVNVYHRQGNLARALLMIETAKKNKIASQPLSLLEKDLRAGKKWGEQSR